MMLAVNITADPISNCASDQYIGEKVITAGEARGADEGRYSISAEADQTIILVFMRNDGRQRPGGSRMSGWERGAAVQKVAAPIIEIGPRALGCAFNDGNVNSCVDHRLGAQQPGLTQTRVVCRSPKKIHGTGYAARAVGGADI